MQSKEYPPRPGIRGRAALTLEKVTAPSRSPSLAPCAASQHRSPPNLIRMLDGMRGGSISPKNLYAVPGFGATTVPIPPSDCDDCSGAEAWARPAIFGIYRQYAVGEIASPKLPSKKGLPPSVAGAEGCLLASQGRGSQVAGGATAAADPAGSLQNSFGLLGLLLLSANSSAGSGSVRTGRAGELSIVTTHDSPGDSPPHDGHLLLTSKSPSPCARGVRKDSSLQRNRRRRPPVRTVCTNASHTSVAISAEMLPDSRIV